MGYWLLIGYFVHKYYMFKDDMKLAKEYMRGEYGIKAYFLGLILTVVAWPIAIYNNEILKK